MIALLRTYLRALPRRRSRWSSRCSSSRRSRSCTCPSSTATIINNGVAKGDTDYILSTGALMLGDLAAWSWSPRSSRSTGARRPAMAFGRDLRGAIFRKVESFSQAELNTFGTPSLITRNTNDVQQVQMVVLMGLNMMIIAPILAVGGVIMALRQDVPLAGHPRRHPADHGAASSAR